MITLKQIHSACAPLCAPMKDQWGLYFCLDSSLSSLKQQFNMEILTRRCHVVLADFSVFVSTTVRPCISIHFQQLPAFFTTIFLFSAQLKSQTSARPGLTHFSYHCCSELLFWIRSLNQSYQSVPSDLSHPWVVSITTAVLTRTLWIAVITNCSALKTSGASATCWNYTSGTNNQAKSLQTTCLCHSNI